MVPLLKFRFTDIDRGKDLSKSLQHSEAVSWCANQRPSHSSVSASKELPGGNQCSLGRATSLKEEMVSVPHRRLQPGTAQMAEE